MVLALSLIVSCGVAAAVSADMSPKAGPTSAASLGLQRGRRLHQKSAPVGEDPEIVEPGENPDKLSFAAVSVLGLQRPSTLQKAGKVVRESVSSLGLQRGRRLHQKSVPVVEELEFEESADNPDKLSFAAVSALDLQRSSILRNAGKVVHESGSSLGLQRATHLHQKSVLVSEPEDVEPVGASRGISWPRKVANRPEDADKISSAAVSILGLQRSSILRKGAKVVRESVSSLGLQRGKRLHQKSAPVVEELELEESADNPDKLSFAAVSILGLQRSSTLRKAGKVVHELGSSLGLQRGRHLHQKSVPVSEVPEVVEPVGASRGISWPRKVANTAEDADKISFAAVSILGLQRSSVLRKGAKVVRESVSSLGLQRGKHLHRKSVPVVDEPEFVGPVEASTGVLWPPSLASRVEDADSLSLAGVSVLGLQRSSVLQKGARFVHR